MSNQYGPAYELRTMVDRLPLETRQAMLEGMEVDRIITGRYADRQGGVCPMFSAHRKKGFRDGMARVRSSWSCFLHMLRRPRAEVSFAKAWDRYARGRTGRGPRPATDSELVALRTMLVASIDRDTARGARELSQAAAAPPAAERAPGRPSAPASGAGEGAGELSGAEGWAWLRLHRRYDEYEDALRKLEELEHRRPGPVGGAPAEDLEHPSPIIAS